MATDTIYLRIYKRNEAEPDTPSLDGQVFLRLAKAFPGLCRYQSEIIFNGSADANCLVPEVLNYLGGEGIDVFNRHGELGYFTGRSRNNTAEDLDAVEYLYQPEIDAKLGSIAVPDASNEMGIPIFSRSMVPMSRLIGTARSPLTHGCMLCRGEAVDKMAKLGLVGLSLVEAPVSSRSNAEIDHTVRVIWSDRVLPPALNLVYSDDDTMIEYDQVPPENGSLNFSEGFVHPAEIHYCREDLMAMGSFDLALMREQTRINGIKETQLVVSQRFRQLMKREFNVEVTGTPVRIRDDRQIPWAGPYPKGWEHKNVRPSWLADFEAKREKAR